MRGQALDPRGTLRRARKLAAALACAAAICAAGAVPASAAVRSGPAKSASWTGYHGGPAATGAVPGIRSVITTARAWTSPTLDGQIYGEPLVFGQRVYVATEDDTVYALSAASGTVEWSAHLGRPVPAGSLPCGDITPTVGITGTPVIDPARSEIFVVADELVQGKPGHYLVGLSTASGRRELAQPVDPPGQDPAAILQRTGLALDDGRVVFGFGGNYGDCGTYRGRLMAVPEAGGKPEIFTVDAAPGDSQGAIWMGGAAPAVDSHGDIWVSTGNGSVRTDGHPYDDSDGLLELSPSLRLLQYFAPRAWPSDNAADLDMSTEPVLLPDGQVIVAKKGGTVYLLNGEHLGGIGGQQAALRSACSSDIDGGGARTGMTVYLPCLSGIVAVRARRSPPALWLLWASRAGGGPPILAAGLVWTIGQNGTLYGLDPATGAIRQQVGIGVPANHFPTPSVTDGLLLAACADNVIAFSAPATDQARPDRQAGPRSGAASQSACAYSPPGLPAPRRILDLVALACLLLAAALGWMFLTRRRGLTSRAATAGTNSALPAWPRSARIFVLPPVLSLRRFAADCRRVAVRAPAVDGRSLARTYRADRAG